MCGCTEELYSPMDTGRKDFLCCSAEHLGWMSLRLNILLYLSRTSWINWKMFFEMVSSLDNILLSVREFSAIPCWHQLPSVLSKRDCTGSHILIEHFQYRLTDIEGPQPPQKVEKALAFLVDG